MTEQAFIFYAHKYFPHLLPEHGKRLVMELWELHRKKT